MITSISCKSRELRYEKLDIAMSFSTDDLQASNEALPIVDEVRR